MRLLVTRPNPEGERTAALLRERGHEVLLQALLRIEPATDAELGDGPWAAVVFTSANAVRAVAAHRRFGELARLPAYAVGKRTQAAAVAAGFAPVMSADGGVNALAELISSRPSQHSRFVVRKDAAANSSTPPCGEGMGAGVVQYGTAVPHRTTPHPIPPPQGGRESPGAQSDLNSSSVGLPLLYRAGEDRAGDLAGALEARGIRVETACVYRAGVVTGLDPGVCAAFAGDAIDAVLHYSARTAAAFVAAAAAAGIRDLSILARHLCLSAQVAAPLVAAGATAIDIASEPNEQALFALIAPFPLPFPARGER